MRSFRDIGSRTNVVGASRFHPSHPSAIVAAVIGRPMLASENRMPASDRPRIHSVRRKAPTKKPQEAIHAHQHAQYNAVLANEDLTVLRTTKNFNADFLLTYLPHPGTAFYLGYNSNLQNLDPSLGIGEFGLLRNRNHFINDGRQLFVKLSYLFRL